MNTSNYPVYVVVLLMLALICAAQIGCSQTTGPVESSLDVDIMDSGRTLDGGPNTFIHNLHSDDLGITCWTCHTKGERRGVPPMDSCMGCHPEAAGMHDTHIDFTPCTDCHWPIEELTPTLEDCIVSHTDYEEHYPLEADQTCWMCHTG